jgi:predicted transcriptional regulator
MNEIIAEVPTTTIMDQALKLALVFMSKPGTTVMVDDIPGLMKTCVRAIKDATEPETAPQVKQEPAISIRKSVTPDYITCLEDGKKFKSLKRHLKTHFNMTPDEYREKWGLPADYPMVAPNYSAARSQLAKDSGLGKK